MVRLPLIKMCSRETNRLPAAKINEILNTSDLPLELQGIPKQTEKFVIYYEGSRDLPEYGAFYTYKFRLAEKIGEFQERIIVEGGATAMSKNSSSGYSTFHGKSQEIGNFAFYCPYFERVI